jgi:hypothetical protein
VLVAEIARRSGGNPLFIEELAAAQRPSEPFSANDGGTVSPDLASLVLRRFDELKRPHRAILELAAVIGQDVTESFVAETGGWPIDDVSDAFAAARRAGIVELPAEPPAPGARTWRFHHELTREAMYERLAPSRRRTLHGQVARAMLDHPGVDRGRPSVDPATLGRHLHAARDWHAALAQSRIAADLARRIQATYEALENDRRALDAALALADPVVARLHLQCGRDLAILGDEAAAENHFREAERRSIEADDLEVRQAALDELAGLAASRDYGLAERLARESLGLAERLGMSGPSRGRSTGSGTSSRTACAWPRVERCTRMP